MMRNGKKNEFYDELVESMTQALAYTRGDQAKGRSVCLGNESRPEHDVQKSRDIPHPEWDAEELLTDCTQLK